MRNEKRNASQPVLPICLLLKDRLVVVVGAGTIADRKISTLLDAEARIRVIAPAATCAIRELADSGGVEWRCREFTPDELDGALLVIAATDQTAVNDAVVEACRERGILVSRVDGEWEQGDFISPLVIREAGWTVALSSGGRDPAAVKALKQRLRELLQSGEAGHRP